jgi:ABC-2 type transport system permease protein
MTDLTTLVAMKRSEIRNRVRGFQDQSALKVAVISVFGVAVWYGLYWLFHRGFWFLRAQGGGPELSQFLMQNILALFFLALTLMLVFSNGIILFGGLYRSRETAFLMAAPVRPVTLFLYRVGESLVFSSWAFLFLVTPLMVAYGQDQGLGPSFHALAAVFFVAYIFIPASLGGIAAMVLTAFFPRSRRAVLLILGGAAAVAAVAILAHLVRHRPTLDGSGDASAFLLFERFRFLRHPLMPNYWIAEGIVDLGSAERARAGFFFRLILSNALFGMLLAAGTARVLLLRGWWTDQGLRYARRFREGAVWRALAAALAPLGAQVRFLVIKDLKTFLRDPVQWTQALIFFGLLGIYFLNLRTFNYHQRMPFWKNLIAQLNLAATCLTLSTFTTRFIFPQLSLEGRRFWVLGMVPMARRRILLGKFLFATGGALGASLTLVALSSFMLDLPAGMVALQGVTVAGVCLGLSGLAVGLGAVYPNFQEDNPSKIVSGFGGTLNLVLSLLFVVVVMALEATPCTLYMTGRLKPDAFPMLAAAYGGMVAGVSALAAALPFWFGTRALDRLET